jgi:large subunit ribosomal protein L18
MVWSRTGALERRHQRIRRKVIGTAQRPRLCVHKSLRHLYAQIVDDSAGRTVCFATTNTKQNKAEAKSFSNIAWAKKLGAELAAKAQAKGIGMVVFDRGGYRHHGIIKAFADAAREGGLKF